MNTNSNKILFKKVITNKVVLDYPRLIKPKSNKNFPDSEPKYGTTIIIPKDDVKTIEKIKQAIKAVIDSGCFTDVNDIKLPLKDGDEIHPGETLYKNSIYLYASSSFKPYLVDSKVQEIKFRMNEFQGGTYAKVCMQFEHYNYNGIKGIKAELISVQILSGNKLLESRSKPEDDFEVEEDKED